MHDGRQHGRGKALTYPTRGLDLISSSVGLFVFICLFALLLFIVCAVILLKHIQCLWKWLCEELNRRNLEGRICRRRL